MACPEVCPGAIFVNDRLVSDVSLGLSTARKRLSRQQLIRHSLLAEEFQAYWLLEIFDRRVGRLFQLCHDNGIQFRFIAVTSVVELLISSLVDAQVFVSRTWAVLLSTKSIHDGHQVVWGTNAVFRFRSSR